MKKTSSIFILALLCLFTFSFAPAVHHTESSVHLKKAVPVFKGRFSARVASSPGDPDVYQLYDVYAIGTSSGNVYYCTQTGSTTQYASSGTFTYSGGVYTVSGISFYDTFWGVTIAPTTITLI